MTDDRSPLNEPSAHTEPSAQKGPTAKKEPSNEIEPSTTAKPLVICVMGPTAAGKTDLAMGLSDRLGGELISVDSALVYRGLNIGSAKPSADELARYPHALVDILDPAETYSAANFVADTCKLVSDMVARGKVPILVGGTMLYFKALLEGMAEMPSANPAVREEIEALAQTHGWAHIHQLLAEVDPQAAERIHPNHSQRLSRALEVYRVSGKPMSEFHREQQEGTAFSREYNIIQLVVSPSDRSILHQRIEQRFENMLKQGFIDEVQQLRQRGDLHLDLPAIRAVGYRQVWLHLDGEYDAEEMLHKGVVATRQLAKRQLTWLRGWPNCHWVDTLDEAGALLSFDEILNKALKFLPESAI